MTTLLQFLAPVPQCTGCQQWRLSILVCFLTSVCFWPELKLLRETITSQTQHWWIFKSKFYFKILWSSGALYWLKNLILAIPSSNSPELSLGGFFWEDTPCYLTVLTLKPRSLFISLAQCIYLGSKIIQKIYQSSFTSVLPLCRHLNTKSREQLN